jgi:chemotaxis response regulator CheB
MVRIIVPTFAEPFGSIAPPRFVQGSTQRWTLRQRRILIAGFPRLMTDILEHVVAKDPALSVVGTSDDASLATEARRTRADVLLVAQRAPDERDSLASLLHSRPRMKVVTIVASGESGALYELRPHRTVISEITTQSLSEAIRDPPGPRRKPRHRRARRRGKTIVAV